MPKRYFDKFPTINYNGYNVRDITVSAKLVDKYVNAPYSYYSYDLNREERVDIVARDYYSDPYMSWMVYYANRVVDPYHDWLLKEEDFITFLQMKYGSVEMSKKKIAFFRTNWTSDKRELSPSQFNGLFGEYTYPHSEYWTPVYNDDFNRVLYYVRAAQDRVVRTNMLRKVETDDSIDEFSEGEILEIRSSEGGTRIGTATVESTSTGSMILRDVLGEMTDGCEAYSEIKPSRHFTITNYSETDDLTQSAWTLLSIPADEYVYWEPVYFYDLEREANELKKTIKLVSPVVANKVADRLELELNGKS